MQTQPAGEHLLIDFAWRILQTDCAGPTGIDQNLGPNRWRIRWHDHTGKRRSKLYTNFDAAQRALRAHQATTDEIRLACGLSLHKTVRSLI
jgi:hypothetical protein